MEQLYTSNFSLAVLCVLSAVFWAWHVNVVLWCNFLGVNFKMDLAVNLRWSGNSSIIYSFPSDRTLPAKSHILNSNIEFTEKREWCQTKRGFFICFRGGANGMGVLNQPLMSNLPWPRAVNVIYYLIFVSQMLFWFILLIHKLYT